RSQTQVVARLRQVHRRFCLFHQLLRQSHPVVGRRRTQIRHTQVARHAQLHLARGLGDRFRLHLRLPLARLYQATIADWAVPVAPWTPPTRLPRPSRRSPQTLPAAAPRPSSRSQNSRPASISTCFRRVRSLGPPPVSATPPPVPQPCARPARAARRSRRGSRK